MINPQLEKIIFKTRLDISPAYEAQSNADQIEKFIKIEGFISLFYDNVSMRLEILNLKPELGPRIYIVNIIKKN